MLEQLNKANAPLRILPADSPDLARYGRLVRGIDCSEMFVQALTEVDLEGPAYKRELEVLKHFESFSKIRSEVYGNSTALQAGLCFGMNDRMNGMEYHRGSEVIVAVSDVVLFLGRAEDITDFTWDSSMAVPFYLPAGSLVELYGNTLHLAPCRVSEHPFCTIIILPEGTNRPLETPQSDDPTYFMKNKWMLCHPESPAAQRGAYVGITGDNIRIKPVESR